MVSVKQDFPSFVLDRDVETFVRVAEPSPRVEQRIRDADPDRQLALLARAWLNNFHGSRHEAKKLFVMFAREEDLPFTGEDIQAITEDPPVETQT